MFLLDTNVLSEPTRPRPEARVLAWLNAVDEDRLYISVISLAEIRRGVGLLSNGRRRERLARWLSRDLPERFVGRILPIDVAVAERWGDLMAKAKTSGAPLPPLDGFLAATVLAHGLTLATRNTADFQVCGAPLFNPWTFPWEP